jgi:hypothetical protein
VVEKVATCGVEKMRDLKGGEEGGKEGNQITTGYNLATSL